MPDIIALAAGLQIAATTSKIYALIIIVTSALACVRPINAGARVCVCALCQAARGRADGRERRTGNRGMRGEQGGSPPPPRPAAPQWIRARRVLGASLEGGLSPPFKMATSHSSIGLDMTAPPRARDQPPF